ncbi:aminopeptidase N [Corynebacterium sp. H113]|uniref:aminopeptidase N n=1 Tax=Corynebacterium sp. H113 TaxID=3133419 RepID=UPI0030ADBD60
MSSVNLTRAEAIERATLVTVQHYDIALDLTTAPLGTSAESDRFRSVTTLSLTANTDGTTFLDLRDADLNQVLIDGDDVTASTNYSSDNGITLNLTAGEHTVVVDAMCQYTKIGQGLHRFLDPADNQTYLYSQFETADAKRVFACFDQPDLKATYSMSVIAPEDWSVVSNSPATITDSTYKFRVDVPLSTYLIAFCAGPWHKEEDVWTGVVAKHPETPVEHQTHATGDSGELSLPLALYCRQSIAEHMDTERLFRETKEGFDFYAKHFGEPYPFGKYDQIFCPEYNMGAMENAACVTIRDEYVFRSKATGYLYERRNDTILHEMAHMWFGDLVTMQWWDDLWLNESFATWSAAAAQAEVSEYAHAWTTFANVEKAWAYQQDQLPSTHPIAADASDVDTVEQNFDGITYAKGASVLKQLVAYVGEEAFLAGARLHFARHRFANATFDDLLSALSEASGRDLSGWADQWLTTTGINTLSPKFDITDGHYSAFSVEQSGAAPGDGEYRDHRVAVGVYSLIDGSVGKQLVRTQRVEVDVTGASTPVPELVGVRSGDVVLVNDDDLTYTLMDFDDSSLACVIDNIGTFTDSMPRTLAWSSTWQMVRSGRMRARDFIALVLRGASSEDKVSVLERIVTQAVQAVSLYADPVWANSTGKKLLGEGLLALAQSETDEGRQLVYVNALSSLPAKAAGTVTALEAIFAGTPEHVGLSHITVDPDMKWRALTALVAAGVRDEDDIAALEAEDKSALGEQSAARARAALPEVDNKKSVWLKATTAGADAPSNLVLRNLMAGFTAPGSAYLLEAGDFTARYFAEATSWWDAFSSDTGANLLEGFYPMWDLSNDAIAQATTFLDGDIPSPVRRIVAENRDRVRRALRAREFDAQDKPDAHENPAQ